MISMMLKFIWITCSIVLLGSCAYMPVKVPYDAAATPPPPDYSKPEYWSALPERLDSADHIPGKSPVALSDGQAAATVDVFYIYPTQFFSRKAWNASLSDTKVNTSVDERAVTNQASVFNGSCKVYIPRYRQATYNAYFSLADTGAYDAFALAYQDIREAFEYYLEHYNHGRPIIIAGHSQGTTHAKWLLRDYFDGKPLQDKLVAAYLLGMPVHAYDFAQIAPCDSAGQSGCYVSWRSYLEGTEQPGKFMVENRTAVVVHNPVTFSRTEGEALPRPGDGGLGRDGETIYTEICTAQIHEDIVWVSRPDIPGKLLIPHNLHVADYNLYWLNIRNNVAAQIRDYEAQHP